MVLYETKCLCGTVMKKTWIRLVSSDRSSHKNFLFCPPDLREEMYTNRTIIDIVSHCVGGGENERNRKKKKKTGGEGVLYVITTRPKQLQRVFTFHT